VKDLEIGKPINTENCSEAAESVARESVKSCPRADAGNLPVWFDELGGGNGAMVEPLRHRQTKGGQQIWST
jgi:hypothetical protein